jgi:serine/threonine protein kinase
MTDLGSILRDARGRLGWTLRRAATEIGISNGYLSLLEQGQVKSPSPTHLSAIAAKYGVPFPRLMELAGHPSGQVGILAADRHNDGKTSKGRLKEAFPDVDLSFDSLQDRFNLGAELGRGGQGVVFHARRLRLPDGSSSDDDVALKIHLDPDQDERVAREIEVMARLRHPCLANLLEHGTLRGADHDARFIVWEFIDGSPLSKRISQGPLSPRLAAIIGRDVSTALTHIWSQRVVHRDVNPKNIMLRRGDQAAVLIDLGAARHLDQNTITAVGTTWGTPGYMSPEQARGDSQLTCFSDVFTLGLTLVEAITARHPTNRRQDLLQTAEIRPSSFLTTAPTGMTQLLDRMLAHRIAFRPSPTVLAQEFGRLADQL